MENTTFIADFSSLTSIKHRVEGQSEISNQVDEKGFSYIHIATNDDTTVTTITAENIPVGKIMFFKYRLCNGYYPAGHFGVTVKYIHNGVEKLAVGTRSGGVLNYELAKRHTGWVVGRVNAQTALKNAGLWTSDDALVHAESITIEIAHKDDLDIAYFMTDNLDANLMPVVEANGNDYYMHQNIEFGSYIENQWRKIKADFSGGDKQYDPFTPPGLPEHPEEGEPVFYTLQFDLNGHGKGSDLSTRSIKAGKKANRPNDPTTTEAFKFGGWYTDAQCTNEYDFTAPVTCDLVLYAKWTKITIADKLQWIAENEQKVYDAGKAEGIEEGKQAEYDFFWDSIQAYGTRTDYEYLFRATRWDRPFNPKYSFGNVLMAHNVFKNTKVGDNLYTDKLDFSKCINMGGAFNGSDVTRLKRIDLRACSSAHNGANSVFIYCLSLREISEFYPPINTTPSMAFYYCESLETINFCSELAVNGLDLQWSGKLSRASIDSIIDHLSPNTSGLTITLSKAAVDKAYEMSEGANNGSSSNHWCDDVVDIWTNWTISLI